MDQHNRDANTIITVLHETCELSREMAVPLHRWIETTANLDDCEWRFQGNLGFGGKLWFEREGWRVSCYPEDETPRRCEAIEKANAVLKGLR